MQKWEYMCIKLGKLNYVTEINDKPILRKLSEVLALIGREGWEDFMRVSDNLLIAKRPKP